MLLCRGQLRRAFGTFSQKILHAKFDAKLHESKLVLGDSLHQDIESSDAPNSTTNWQRHL